MVTCGSLNKIHYFASASCPRDNSRSPSTSAVPAVGLGTRQMLSDRSKCGLGVDRYYEGYNIPLDGRSCGHLSIYTTRKWNDCDLIILIEKHHQMCAQKAYDNWRSMGSAVDQSVIYSQIVLYRMNDYPLEIAIKIWTQKPMKSRTWNILTYSNAEFQYIWRSAYEVEQSSLYLSSYSNNARRQCPAKMGSNLWKISVYMFVCCLPFLNVTISSSTLSLAFFGWNMKADERGQFADASSR